jgi:hypothetical protein
VVPQAHVIDRVAQCAVADVLEAQNDLHWWSYFAASMS